MFNNKKTNSFAVTLVLLTGLYKVGVVDPDTFVTLGMLCIAGIGYGLRDAISKLQK